MISGQLLAANAVTVDSEDLAGVFHNGKTLSFFTELENQKKFVVTCNNAYGLLGLSDPNFIAYNRITPGHRLTVEECSDVLANLESGMELVFHWELANPEDPWGLKYITGYYFQPEPTLENR